MIERIHGLLNRITSYRRATVAWLVTVVLLVTYSFYIAPLEVMAGGQTHLDVRFGGYSLEDVLAYFVALGDQGRALYTRTTAFDTVWPLCVSLTGALWAPLVFRNGRWVVAAAFCPVMFGVLDAIENCGIWLMLAQFPDVSPAVVRANNVVTLVKQAMIPGWVVALIALPIVGAVRHLNAAGDSTS